MSYYSKILTILFSLLLLSCNKEFNSKEWQNTTLEDNLDKNNNRNLMINDLVENKLLMGKNSKEIKTLLGKPDLKDSTKNTFRYETFIDHGWNIDPKYFRGLEIYFNKDSIVTSVKIYEIKTR